MIPFSKDFLLYVLVALIGVQSLVFLLNKKRGDYVFWKIYNIVVVVICGAYLIV